MKKIFLAFLLSFVTEVMANAQDYETFKVGFGSGFTLANLGERYADGGILFTFEPAFHLNNDLVIGCRLEFADTYLNINYGGNPINSLALSGEYYFGTKKFRPLVGFGAGLFKVPSATTSSENKFGFYPRIGFDFGHFFLDMEYNLVQTSESIYLDKIKNDYFGFRIGFFAGGGKKMPSQLIQEGNQ